MRCGIVKQHQNHKHKTQSVHDQVNWYQDRDVMTNEQGHNLLRLRKKHAPGDNAGVTSADGERLVRAQSIRNAVISSLAVIILFSVLWAALSELTNRVFPWLTMLLGMLLGLTIRRAGKGIDWRFPLLAAVFAIGGALFANIIVAAALQASDMGVGTLQLLRSVTIWTWRDFFIEVITSADVIFAGFAAAIAAFYANPKLSRNQFLALKLWQQERDNE
jgi:prepilin signal peptidase PulO-like enzyme (type II secretory pathway)